MVEFHAEKAGCDGADGMFRGSRAPAIIDVCTPNRYIVLHELAHAWDFFTLDDQTRKEFMELRGLSEWSGHQVPWSERGIEDLAEIVTWGLYEHPVTANAAEKERAFRLITGLSPGHQPIESESVPSPTDDRIDSHSDWDTVH